MKRSLIAIVIMVWCACACTKTIYLEKEKLVEVKEYVTQVDTIIIPRVQQEVVEKVVEIQDTSRLETTHAMSEAFVAEGQLHHSLWQKPETFKFDIQIPTLHKDSIIRVREPYPVEVVKEVKTIPAFYKACFWLILGEVIIAVIALVLKFKRI